MQKETKDNVFFFGVIAMLLAVIWLMPAVILKGVLTIIIVGGGWVMYKMK